MDDMPNWIRWLPRTQEDEDQWGDDSLGFADPTFGHHRSLRATVYWPRRGLMPTHWGLILKTLPIDGSLK